MHFLHLLGGNQFLVGIELEQAKQRQVMRGCVESATRFGFKAMRRSGFAIGIPGGYVLTSEVEAARRHVQGIEQARSHEFREWTLAGALHDLA